MGVRVVERKRLGSVGVSAVTKTRARDFLKLRSASVSTRLGNLWLIIVNGDDLLALEASWPSGGRGYAYFALGQAGHVRAEFWKIIGPLSASGDFYILMRAELVEGC